MNDALRSVGIKLTLASFDARLQQHMRILSKRDGKVDVPKLRSNYTQNCSAHVVALTDARTTEAFINALADAIGEYDTQELELMLGKDVVIALLETALAKE